ncbi:MAG TPA: hypothetical protein VN370_02410 [Desulfitobacteriaceae bacterium]|nr:hypothetical protein [Desulfitobacteriaceae bacterium]
MIKNKPDCEQDKKTAKPDEAGNRKNNLQEVGFIDEREIGVSPTVTENGTVTFF